VGKIPQSGNINLFFLFYFSAIVRIHVLIGFHNLFQLFHYGDKCKEFEIRKNKKKGIIKFIGIFSIIFNLHMNSHMLAQQKKHYAGLHVGVGILETRDRLVSPLIYDGIRIPLSLVYEYVGDTHRHSAFLSYHSGKLFCCFPNKIYGYMGEFEYRYYRRVTGFSNNLKCFVGGSWNSFYYDRYSSFQPYYDEAHLDVFSYEVVSSWNLAFMVEYQMNLWEKWCIQMASPLLTFISRPGYALGPPEGEDRHPVDMTFGERLESGKFVFINKYWQIRLSAFYELIFFRRMAVRGKYSFVFYTYEDYRKTGTVMNEIGLEVYYSF